MRLRHSDYEAALSLVAEAADTSGMQPFEFPAIERLLQVIPAQRAGYYEYHGGGVACGGGIVKSSVEFLVLSV